jgi:hypothetical protein
MIRRVTSRISGIETEMQQRKSVMETVFENINTEEK